MTRGPRSAAYFRRWASVIALAIFAALIGQGAVAAAEERINTGYFGDVAIRGYDPVAYFTMGKAVQGSEEFAYDWLGAKWHFANEEHRELFAAEPVKYAPQYGGYCAIGVAFDVLVANIDPKAWFITDGKLFLQYAELNDVDFRANQAELVATADKNWPKTKLKDQE
jgi:YHS domain-containing protein